MMFPQARPFVTKCVLHVPVSQLAGGAILQGPEAIAAHQDLRRHQPQRGDGPDLDSTDRHAGGQVPTAI